MTTKLDRPGGPRAAVRLAMLLGMAIVVVLATLVGWLGFRVHQAHQTASTAKPTLQAARQGALNLTTIDWQHADADVQRILDGATGQFHDDFAKRSQPFIDVVKQAKSTRLARSPRPGWSRRRPTLPRCWWP